MNHRGTEARRLHSVLVMRPSLRRTLVFAALLLWCAALYVVRVERGGRHGFEFLPWNMTLAVVPAVAAAAFAAAHRRGFPAVAQAALFVVWLLFLPNAPYLVTDFMHLRQHANVPIWFDIALMTSAVATALLLAFNSLAEVQAVIAARFGKGAGWFTAVAALLLSAAGIYLGRFLRWNSWDALVNPHQLMADVARRGVNPLEHPRSAVVTLVYGVSLMLGYLALRFVGGRREELRARTDGDRRRGVDRRSAPR